MAPHGDPWDHLSFGARRLEQGDTWELETHENELAMDELILAHDRHLVLSPQGYHPVVAAPGCNCYYLNMLAGSAQSLGQRNLERERPTPPLVSMNME